jgi:hypothetical protein
VPPTISGWIAVIDSAKRQPSDGRCAMIVAMPPRNSSMRRRSSSRRRSPSSPPMSVRLVRSAWAIAGGAAVV